MSKHSKSILIFSQSNAGVLNGARNEFGFTNIHINFLQLFLNKSDRFPV